ncbi:MAG TPA: competence/damage-inducible protein A [Gemmatimonadales bacterium]
MKIELVTIGDELLLGFTIDTNSAFIARELGEYGISVVRRTTVGDAAEEIAGAVGEALERTGAVITTGGLGPTADDRTREAIARLFGRELRQDDGVAARLRAWWERRGRAGGMPASNLVQALVPEGARVLENRHGTAPGIWIEDDRGRWVAMLPGVPRELRGMISDTMIPELARRAGTAGAGVVRSRTLRTTGISESAVADIMSGVEIETPVLSLAYLPGPEGLDLRLTARGLPADEADVILTDAAARLRSLVGRHVYGEDADDLAAVVLDLCRARSMRVAVAESCTGGLLGWRLTAPSGSSDVFEGGIIAYDNRVKLAQLGVPVADLERDGAVSRSVARAMATGARTRLGTAIGVGITGVAGPGGGSAEKPVGTVWIAADVDGEVRDFRGHFVGDRAEVRWRAAQAALELLRRMLHADDAD